MNESHKWPQKNSSYPDNVNNNPDWATMARQWVELQNQQSNPLDQALRIDKPIDNAESVQYASFPHSGTPVDGLISSYQPQYDFYLQQEIMHQQLLAAAHWTSQSQTIYPPYAQYMVPDIMSFNQGVPQSNPSGHSSQNFSYVHDTARPVSFPEKIMPLERSPLKADLTTSLEEPLKDQTQMDSSLDDARRKDLNSSLNPHEMISSDTSKLISKSGQTSSCYHDLKSDVVLKQADKGPLKPYIKKPIPIMTLSRSSNSQTNSKSVSKIPQWIKEGLERIERERARKLEKERLEALEKELNSDSSTHIRESSISRDRSSPNLERSATNDGEDGCDKTASLDLDIKLKDKDHVDMWPTSQGVKQRPSSIPQITMNQDYEDEESEDDEDNLKDKDEKLNIVLRREMTRLLLEVTNQLIESACSEIYEKMKCEAVSETGAKEDRLTTGTCSLAFKFNLNEKLQSKPLGHLVGYECSSSSDDEGECDIDRANSNRRDKFTKSIQDKINCSSSSDCVPHGFNHSMSDQKSLSCKLVDSRQNNKNCLLDQLNQSNEDTKEVSVSKALDRERSRSRDRGRHRHRNRSRGEERRHKYSKKNDHGCDRYTHRSDESKLRKLRSRDRSRSLGSSRDKRDHRKSGKTSQDNRNYRRHSHSKRSSQDGYHSRDKSRT